MHKILSPFKLKIEIITCIVLVTLPLYSMAQRGEKLTLTLEKARTIAATKNPEITAGAIDAQINKEATAEAKLKRIPQVYGDFNLQRNLIIPVTPVPANAFDPNAAEGELLPLRFTTKWTSNTGLNANVDLFNPQKKQAIKEAQIKQELTKLENTNNINTINFDIGIAYISALTAAEQLKLAIVDTVAKAETLKMTQQLFNEGRLLLSALNQIKADRNNTLNNFEEAAYIYANRKAQLLYYMGFSTEDDITIEFQDNLESLFQAFQKTIDTNTLSTYSLNRLKYNDALLNTQIQGAVNGYLPTLALKGYYGANYFDNNFDLFKSSNWNGNSFVNLGIKVPISEGLERQKKIKQLKLRLEANKLRYENEQNKNRLDYLSAKRESVVYQKNYLRTQENFKLAEKNLKLAEQQFANGRLLISELAQVNYNYHKEKNSYLNMAYDFLSAKLLIEKLSK